MSRLVHLFNLVMGLVGMVYLAVYPRTVGFPWNIPVSMACGACAGYAAIHLLFLARRPCVARAVEPSAWHAQNGHPES